MKKEDVAKLQSAKILNMAAIYRELDYHRAEIGTRLRRPNSGLPKGFTEKLEKKIMDKITEVIKVSNLDVATVISRILAEVETHGKATYIIDKMREQEVPPIGYINYKDYVVAVYLHEDAYRPRQADHDAQVRFYSLPEIMNLPGNLELTNRGRITIADVARNV